MSKEPVLGKEGLNSLMTLNQTELRKKLNSEDLQEISEEQVLALLDDLGLESSVGESGTIILAGRGIQSIDKTGSEGLVDTYTIMYTDGTSSSYTVTNGRDGKDGENGTGGTTEGGASGITVDAVITDGSSHPIESNAVYNALYSDQVRVGTNSASYNGSVGIGKNAFAGAPCAVAVGENTVTTYGSMALGSGAKAPQSFALAVGMNAFVGSGQSEAIGYQANANGGFSTAIGTQATANNSSIAIGNNTIGNGYSIAIGRGAAANQGYSVAVGANAACNGGQSVALGYSSNAGGNAICIGYAARANDSAISIGNGTYGDGGISIGNGMGSGNPGNSVRIGYVSSVGNMSVAIGYGSSHCENACVALGGSAYCNANVSVAVGFNSGTNADNSIALGPNAVISGASPNTIQLGDTYISALKCKVGITTTSDERDKTDITEIGDGAVEFLEKVKAIRYLYNGRVMYLPEEEDRTEQDNDNLAKYGICAYDKEAHDRGDKKGSRVRVGVSAQAVQAAMQEVYGDSSYGNIVDDNLYDVDKSTIPEGIESQLSVNYANFVPFLIKGIQELSAEIKELRAKVDALS